jgi:hypothetical protein
MPCRSNLILSAKPAVFRAFFRFLISLSKNTGAHQSGYTNAPIVPQCHSQCNARAEVESSTTCSVSQNKRAIGSDTNHAHYTRRDSALDCTRGFADLAL